MTEGATLAEPPVQVWRWPTERPLLVLVALAAIAIWILLAVSIFGIVYGVLIGVFFFFSHLAFVAHLRGNGVRLGPGQMPELHARVVELARRVGLRNEPVAYVIQAGGQLNTLATKFLGTSFVVLYSDLIEACGDNSEARDFIIAHELGHLKAGHLRMRWILIPGLALPFLGTAYSRACEYTCDRFGMAASTNEGRALDGLCVLAAGGRYGPRVNRHAMVAQRGDLNTFWMKIGQWLSTHPPIAARLVALQPSLAEGAELSRGPAVVAGGAILLLIVVPFIAMGVFFSTVWPQFKAGMARQQKVTAARANPASARAMVQEDLDSLAEAAESRREKSGEVPTNADQLYETWKTLHSGEPEPTDPFDGQRFGYERREGEFVIWSVGPDVRDSSDDIYYSSNDPDDD